MEYRKLPHGDEMISVIGMGTSVVGEKSSKNVTETVSYALEHGINYFDMAGGHASIFQGMEMLYTEEERMPCFRCILEQTILPANMDGICLLMVLKNP